jgi:hypothetical protein
MVRIVAVFVLAVTFAACGGTTSSAASLSIPPPSRSPTPMEAAIATICAPPAFAACSEEMEQFFEGWTADKLHGQVFGVCAGGLKGGTVVWIDAKSHAKRECRDAEATEVVRVVRLP